MDLKSMVAKGGTSIRASPMKALPQLGSGLVVSDCSSMIFSYAVSEYGILGLVSLEHLRTPEALVVGEVHSLGTFLAPQNAWVSGGTTVCGGSYKHGDSNTVDTITTGVSSHHNLTAAVAVGGTNICVVFDIHGPCIFKAETS